MPSSSPTGGVLWIVATPLGNPGDFSPRARQTLANADFVLAEDTRRAGLLCAQCGIAVRRFVSFHDHNEAERQADVLRQLEAGGTAALISDAGTPLVADPGYRLVRACRAAGVRVAPVPGPSAPVTALSAAGLPPLPYTFLGFLPRDAAGRAALFSAFRRTPGSLVFFERRDRLRESLAQAAEILGPRALAICRELTKTHEEFILDRLENAAAVVDVLGEITVVIGPPEHEERSPEEAALAVLREELDGGGKPRECARRAAVRLDGWTSKELYALVREL